MNTCPECGYKLEMHSAVGGGDPTPEPGAISICFQCAALLMFDEQLREVPISEQAVAELKETGQWKEIQIAIEHVRAAGYGRTCQRMVEDYKKWRAAHPKTSVLINFRIPKGAFVIASLEDALKSGTLVVDYNGKRMLREMGWLENKRTMPTLAQVKAVIELAHGCPISEDEKT